MLTTISVVITLDNVYQSWASGAGGRNVESGMRRHPLHGRVRLGAVALVLITAGCAPSYSSAALGQYELYQPYARQVRDAFDVELTRAGYVAVIEVLTPTPTHRDLPVLFRASYPEFPTDQHEFPAGDHQLRSRQTTFIQPRNCGRTELPAIDGCRRDLRMLPGVHSLGEYRVGVHHYIAIVADEPVDPFTIAEELFYIALENPLLSRQLKELDADLAAASLEQALLDRPGTANWAAHYVTAR